MDINFLILGAILSAITAVLHIGCILFGASWYRFFGAGEKMAILAEQGSLIPAFTTSFIVLTLFVWSLYALSGAGTIPQMPLLGLGLLVITAVYLIRGILGLFFIIKPMGRSPWFWLWSSVICLAVGAVHFIGLLQN